MRKGNCILEKERTLGIKKELTVSGPVAQTCKPSMYKVVGDSKFGARIDYIGNSRLTGATYPDPT